MLCEGSHKYLSLLGVTWSVTVHKQQQQKKINELFDIFIFLWCWILKLSRY